MGPGAQRDLSQSGTKEAPPPPAQAGVVSATWMQPREWRHSSERDGVGSGPPEPYGRPPVERHRRSAFSTSRDWECDQRVQGKAAERQSVPGSLRRTMQIVRLTHTGNRVDRDSFGWPGAEGINAGHRPSQDRHPEVRGALEKAQRREPPRSPVSRTPSGGSRPKESAQEMKGSPGLDCADFFFLWVSMSLNNAERTRPLVFVFSQTRPSYCHA